MKNWVIFLISLLVACLVWVLHALSLNYSTYLQCKVTVTTNIEGYSNTATANEILLVRGKTSGYLVILTKGFKGDPIHLPLMVEPNHFSHCSDSSDIFSVPVSVIREKIVETLGEHLTIEYIKNDSLTFNFSREEYRKIPVNLVSTMSFKPQYMKVGEIELIPDTILVYGPAAQVSKITEIQTKALSLMNINESIQGYVELEQMPGIRFSEETIHYSLEVERYVETSRKTSIEVTNVPSDKRVTVIPSEVTLTCRIPFGLVDNPEYKEMTLVVDYNNVVDSKSSKAIPTLVNSENCEVLSYSLTPSLVDCIIVESK